MIGYIQEKQANSFFEIVDLFGANVNIRYNKKVNFNTRCGGFITCALTVILVLYSYTIVEVYYSHSSVQVIQEKNYVENQQKYSLKMDQFSFMLSLTDINYTTFIDDKIYTLTVTQLFIVRTFNQHTGQYEQDFKSRQIQMERCTKNHFQVQDTANYFLQQSYTECYCFSRQQTDIALQGDYNSATFQSVEIEIQQCDGQECASPQEMQKKLDNCYLQIYFTDSNIIPTNLNQPLQPVGKSLFYLGGTTLSKTINIYMIQTNVNTYQGIVTDDIQTQSTLIYSLERESVVTRSTDRLFLIQISLEPNKELNYYRKYLTLSQVLSQIGGIYNILFAFGRFICKPFAQLQYKRSLINTVFGFEYYNKQDQQIENIAQNSNHSNSNDNNLEQMSQDKKIESKIDEVISQETEIKNDSKEKSPTIQSNSKKIFQFSEVINSQSNIFNFFSKPKKKHQEQKPQDLSQSIHFNERMNKKQRRKTQLMLMSFFRQTFEELKLNTIDYIRYYINFFICKKKNKSKIIDYGLKKLYNHLDIYFIVNKLIEFEKFKRLLLNDNQIKLFEYIPKPIIKIDKSSQEIIKLDPEHQNMGILYEDNRTFLQKSEEAQEAYNKIMKDNQKKTYLDEKLIKLLHPKLVDLFKDNLFEKWENNQQKIYKLNPRKTLFNSSINNQSPTFNLQVRETPSSSILNFKSQSLQHRQLLRRSSRHKLRSQFC